MAGVGSDFRAFATVQRGRLQYLDRRLFDQQVAQWKDGTVVQLELTTRRASRSVQANRFYWSVVLQLISEHTGDEPDDLHVYFKQRFLPKQLAIVNGNGIATDAGVIGGSTRHLSTDEFTKYLERIIQFAAEFLDLAIPEAEPHGLPSEP